MAKEIAFYTHCIKKILSEYECWKSDKVETELVFDDERMRYLVMRIGWRKQKRVHYCLVHIDICGEKIIIQENNTEDLLATELERMGVPKEKIDIGFIPPEAQQYLQQAERAPQEEFVYA